MVVQEVEQQEAVQGLEAQLQRAEVAWEVADTVAMEVVRFLPVEWA